MEKYYYSNFSTIFGEELKENLSKLLSYEFGIYTDFESVLSMVKLIDVLNEPLDIVPIHDLLGLGSSLSLSISGEEALSALLFFKSMIVVIIVLISVPYILLTRNTKELQKETYNSIKNNKRIIKKGSHSYQLRLRPRHSYNLRPGPRQERLLSL